jgi:hypothetical protein
MRRYIRVGDDIMILVSHISEIRPKKDYPELSAICPNEMRYGTKSVVGNATTLHPTREDKGICPD